jgi:hypothetical protein
MLNVTNSLSSLKAEIHQALLSLLSLLGDFFIENFQSMTKIQ